MFEFFTNGNHPKTVPPSPKHPHQKFSKLNIYRHNSTFLDISQCVEYARKMSKSLLLGGPSNGKFTYQKEFFGFRHSCVIIIRCDTFTYSTIRYDTFAYTYTICCDTYTYDTKSKNLPDWISFSFSLRCKFGQLCSFLCQGYLLYLPTKCGELGANVLGRA